MPRAKVRCVEPGCPEKGPPASAGATYRCRPHWKARTTNSPTVDVPRAVGTTVFRQSEAEPQQPLDIRVQPEFRVTPKQQVVQAPRILVIPDTQVKPGVDIEHLKWAGRYAAAKQPDAIVIIGDWWDMPSLSSYDKGKKQFEGRRYRADIEAGHAGMENFMSPIRRAAGYAPRIVFTEGNHEYRATRAVEESAMLEGVIGPHDFRLDDYGIEYHPFLEVVEIAGVEFSHYFTSGVMGRPVASAAALLRARMGSAVMGHTQTTDISFHQKTRHIGMFVGTFYTHDEEYLGFQGNNQRRQIVMMNEVRDSTFDPMFLSIEYLARRFS